MSVRFCFIYFISTLHFWQCKRRHISIKYMFINVDTSTFQFHCPAFRYLNTCYQIDWCSRFGDAPYCGALRSLTQLGTLNIKWLQLSEACKHGENVYLKMHPTYLFACKWIFCSYVFLILLFWCQLCEIVTPFADLYSPIIKAFQDYFMTSHLKDFDCWVINRNYKHGKIS